MTSSVIAFAPFRLDPNNAQLWRGDAVVALRPKTFALLAHLAQRPGQLVTKNELLDVVWPNTAVTDTVLKVCIRELRRSLDDAAQHPRFIETVHRRGYRFIAPVQVSGPWSAATPSPDTTGVVGRERELGALHRAASQAAAGRRQIVFVTGEPGIGKTTLVDSFLMHVEATVVARGQCVEQYGAAEAFLPMLEAFTRLCRQSGGDHFVRLLREHAPSWLLQMPGVLAPRERAALQREYADASRVRMLRELVVGIDALTADRPIILVLEDLHWSDHSTLELLAALARRHEPAQLLVISTFRPVDGALDAHPLPAMVQELLRHRHAVELPLQRLDGAEVAAYVAGRFPGGEFATTLSPLLHRHTDGNPLFMVNATDHLVSCGLIRLNHGAWLMNASASEVARAVPASLRHTIGAQLDTFTAAEQRTLEAASVAGMEFALAAVTPAVHERPEQVAAHCVAAVRRRLLRSAGFTEWPDGTSAPRYSFTHALYHEALYERVPAARRVRLHQRIGERLEAGYGAHTAEIAAELAMHFERAQDCPRAVRYYHRAGQNAVQRHAYQEAIVQLTRALELLETVPPTVERDQQELDLRITLGIPLLNTKGFAAPDVERTYARALELCRRLGETPQLFPVIEGLHSFYAIRGELPEAYRLAQQMMRLSEATQDRVQLLEAHHAMGCSEYWRAEFSAARAHLEVAIALYDPQHSDTAFQQSGHDPKVCCLGHLGITLWFAGYADQARQRAQEALTFAEALRHPSSLALARVMMAWVHLLRGESRHAHEFAEAALALAREHGLVYWAAQATILRGSALAAHGDAAHGGEQLQRGLSGYDAIGAGIGRTEYLSLRAEVSARCGRPAEGLVALAEAFDRVTHYGERYLEPELYRLKGELLMQQESMLHGSPCKGPPTPLDPQSEAERCFHHAIEIARQQQSKVMELRATRSLSRLWNRQGKRAEAERLLANVYAWFTEGFETIDLTAAAMLLHELRSPVL